MVLNDFRSQVIEWDKATGGIYESVSASKGDSNGRKLIVHILNEREEEDLTGSVLSLAWNLKENQGLDAFVPIDETKGIFEIYYTTGMLSNIGTLTASLVLVTPDGRIESKPFKIFVQESVVDDTAVQSQNSFTTLTQAIVQFAEWGSRFEAVEQDYKDRAAALETTYAPRLISAEQDITTNHQEVTAQLAQTIRKGEASVSDIDKNKGLLDETYLSDTLKQQIAGNTPIHSTSENWSVTLKKTSFAEPKKNLFDKNNIEVGYALNTSTGQLSSNSNYSASEFVKVTGDEDYVFTNVVAGAWYTADKTFISANMSSNLVKSPKNAVYLRVSTQNERVDGLQVEKGSARTAYEPYTLLIKNKYLEKKPIGIDEVEFTESGKNKFNKDVVFEGILTNADGTITPSIGFRSSDFIKIKPDNEYSYQGVYKLVWYDSNREFVSVHNFGSVLPGTIVSPNNAYYIRITVRLEDIDLAQLEEGSTPTNYESFRRVIDREYLPNIEQSVPTPIQSTGDDFEARRAIAERNAHEYIPNASEPLDIPTYEGSGQTTHPSVLYFEDGWNGYRFWMAHTPYPNSDNFYENPSVVASNDNKTWHEPATNPIAPLLTENTYQSDPCIFMNGDTMEMWYRATTGTLTEIFRMTTTDGVNWTSREKLFDTDTFEMVRSQTVRMIDGKYCMWYTSGTKTGGVTLKYSESVDGKIWTGTKFLNIELDKRFTWWHGDVIVENGLYEMVIMCQSDTEPWSTFYTYSYDNENWTPATLLIKPTENSLRFDSGSLYRPAMVMVDDEYYVYYSTTSKIALTKGKTIYSLGIEEDSSYPKLFPIATGRTENNAYTASDTRDKFPSETITYTKIFNQEGFPTTSGILKTDSVWIETTNCRQYFYPYSSDNHYTRRATTDGWSSWKEITAVTT